jgi:cytidylate kinase
VIVNHAAQVRLAQLPGVLRVLVVGGEEQRARRLAQARGSDLVSARKTLQDSDQQRTDFYKRIYHIDWLGMGNYDLALNSDLISADLAVDMVAAAAREVR